MIGIPGGLARKVLRRRPANGLTDHEMMEVWLSPSAVPWQHRPNSQFDGPFRVIRASNTTDAVFALQEHLELADALRAFCLRNLPSPGEMAAVVDIHDQMILGWADGHRPNILEADEERYIWFGCERVFHILARIHNVIDVAFWERIALERYE